MWIFINDNLINIFNIDRIEILSSNNKRIHFRINEDNSILLPPSIYSYICIIFKNNEKPLIIRKDSIKEAEQDRDLILIECNKLTNLLPRLIIN